MRDIEENMRKARARSPYRFIRECGQSEQFDLRPDEGYKCPYCENYHNKKETQK